MRTKRILILLNSYFPELNANVICAQRYIEALKKEGCQIDIFAGRQDRGLKKSECIDGVNVYRFDNWYIQLIQGLNSLYYGGTPVPGIVKKFSIPLVILLKSILHLFDMKNLEPIEDNVDVSEYVDKAVALANDSAYDSIVSFSLPYMTMYAGMKIQEAFTALNKRSRFIVCEFDPFTTNYHFGRRRRRRRLNSERLVLEKADRIVIPPELENDFRQCFPELLERVKILTFPNLEQREEWKIPAVIPSRKTIECVYVGNFYEKIRNPKRVLEILSAPELEKAVIHIYGSGCYRELAHARERMGERLKLHGYQSRELVLEAIRKADITISIGNTVANQTPSKIFELIASGKPILHFYRTDEDSSLRYLRKYPCMLEIDERRDTKEMAVKISRFMNESAGKNISFEKATEFMGEYTSKTVTKEFIEIAGIKSKSGQR